MAGNAPHAPHVRTKRPLHGRRPSSRPAALPRGHHSSTPAHARKALFRFARRGPRTALESATTTASDLAFRVGAGGVMVAAMVLGVILGVTHPTWMLGLALGGAGVLLAAYVVVRARHAETA